MIIFHNMNITQFMTITHIILCNAFIIITFYTVPNTIVLGALYNGVYIISSYNHTHLNLLKLIDAQIKL